MEKEKKLRTVAVKLRRESSDTYNGYFHGWNECMNTDLEGKEYIYKVAIIEKVSDGEVIEVDPELICFTD